MNEEEKRICEAKNCNSCLAWHKYCNAECCKSIHLAINPKRLKEPGEFLLIKVGNIPASEQRYYRLHGIRFARGTLRFEKNKIKVINGKVFYFDTCSALDENNKCTLHDRNKPKMCRELTLETCNQAGRFLLTDNCLFKYKLKGGLENVKKEDRCEKTKEAINAE